MHERQTETLWNGEQGAGGISWSERSRMGFLRGVIDAADNAGRRNSYMHTLHTRVLKNELRRSGLPKRALDFGCGTGRFLKTLAEHCTEVYALDREPDMVDAARTYAGKYAKRIECWRVGKSPFALGTMDFVLCSSVLCVTTAELFCVSLNEIASLCRPGATLLLLEQVAPGRGLTLSRYRESLASAGFAVVRAYPIRAASSVITALVTAHENIPAAWFDTLAAIELASTARGVALQRLNRYVEYAMVARRR